MSHKEHLFPERNETESSSFTLSLIGVQNVGGAGKHNCLLKNFRGE